MDLDLSDPVEGDCPLCGVETVEFRENKAGKPYFQCKTHKVAVNLNGGEQSAELVVNSANQAEAALNEPDDAAADSSEGDGSGESSGEENVVKGTLDDLLGDLDE